MTEIITILLIPTSFIIGMLLARTNSKKELSSLNDRVIQLASEREDLTTTLSSKAREFSENHVEMLKQHANELAKHRDEHRSILETQENESRDKLRVAEDKAFNEGLRQAELRNSNYTAGFSVQIRPYVAKIKKAGLIFDDMYSAVGFQYQLLVNGIPCFQPHVMIEQEYEETEVNDERLKFLTEQAIKVAQLALKSTNAQDLFKFVDSPLIAEQKK